MHKAAKDFCEKYRNNDQITVVEIGSRNINGTIRGFWPHAKWIGLDLYPGVDVDVVADASTWRPPEPVDLVMCCEVLEHAPNWADLIKAASEMLKVGGHLIMTCAGPGRKPHSHHDGKNLRAGEHYGNLSARQIGIALANAGFAAVHLAQLGADTQCCAVLLNRYFDIAMPELGDPWPVHVTTDGVPIVITETASPDPVSNDLSTTEEQK